MWSTIEQESHLQSLLNQTEPLVIFKHSERCSVSRMAKRTFENEYESEVPVYLIHVIDERPISNKIAEITGINHQSPQLLIIKDGKCVYHASHDHISALEIKAYL